MVPALIAALARPLRPVAPHLFTVAERGIMADLVSLLLDYGFNFDFSCTDTLSETAQLALRPALETLSSFPVSSPLMRSMHLG